MGANNYIMIGNRSMFVELNEYVNNNITFRDNSKVPKKGKCIILFRIKYGSYQLISNIYYVSNMKKKLSQFESVFKKWL